MTGYNYIITVLVFLRYMHVTVQLILMYLFYFINLLTSLTWFMQQVSRTCCMHVPSQTIRDISKITDLATLV